MNSQTNWLDWSIGLIFSIGNTFLSAVYALCFWNWFIGPLFPADIRPDMTYGWILGLSLAVSFIFGSHNLDKNTDNSDEFPHTSREIAKVIAYLIIFGIGAIIHACVGTIA